MMTFRMGKNSRYILIAGGLLLLIGLAYRLFPFCEYVGGVEEQIAMKEKRIAKYMQLLQEGGGIEDELKALEQTIREGESRLLTAQTTSIAAADVQNIVQNMASESGVEIKTVRVLKPEALDKGDYLSIPVQLTITSDIGPFAHFLHLIEMSQKNLTVKTLKIRVSLARAKSTQSQLQAPPKPVILADLTVHGFLKKAKG